MNIAKELRAQRQIAKQYEERGYLVKIEPSPSDFPFPLDGYRPDILASKADEHIIVDVKTAEARVDTELYFRLDERVRQHPGWKFLLVTVSDLELEDEVASGSEVGADEIEARLRSLDRLVENAETAGLVFPVLWTAFVSALRLSLSEGGFEAERNSDLGILNKAYAGGIFSFDDYEAARRLMVLRNRAVHSLGPVATTEDCKELRQMVGAVLNGLAAPHAASPNS